VYPASEVFDVSEIVGNGAAGIPELGQVFLERDDRRPDGTGGKPIYFDGTRERSGIHGDLQKWITSTHLPRNYVQFTK
jgi:hypothetical protein